MKQQYPWTANNPGLDKVRKKAIELMFASKSPLWLWLEEIEDRQSKETP